MQSSFAIDLLFDALAERVAAKVRAKLAEDGASTGVKPRLLSVEQAAIYLGRSKHAVEHMVASVNTDHLTTDHVVPNGNTSPGSIHHGVRLQQAVFADLEKPSG